MADEKQTLLDADDDWLTEIEGKQNDDEFGQIDQASIDQLLGEAGIDQKSEPEAGMDGTAPSTPASAQQMNGEEGSFELDQASLDAMLEDSGDASGSEAVAGGPATDLQIEAPAVDQSSLSALFDTDDEDFQAALAVDSNVPSQSDIDELFAQAHEGDGGTASRDDDIDMNELFGGGPDNSAPPAEDLSASEPASHREEPDAAQAVAFLSEEDATLNDDIFNEEAAAASAPRQEVKAWQRFLPQHLLAKVSRPMMGGFLVTALLLAGSIYFFAVRGRVPAPPPTAINDQRLAVSPPAADTEKLARSDRSPQAVPAGKPLPADNTPPTVKDEVYQMPETGGEIPLLLFAQDDDGDSLTYEITAPPSHGRLAGDLPMPVYLPNKDFPGSDQLEYRVTDGRQYSDTAAILITGPNLQPAAEQEPDSPAIIAPKQPFLQAHDITLKTLSTRELVIDWPQLWQQTRNAPFPKGASVEILAEGLQGRLTQIDPLRHRYLPDRLFSGSETIGYRLRQGSVSSKRAELRLLVDRGDHPPEIRFHSLPDKEQWVYLVGETVVLDASGTDDDDPESLRFEWRQTAGPPVRLKQLNEEGSIVSFVVPSSFHTVPDPGPVLHLTVTDSSGQSDKKTVRITPRSRRHSALWHGAALQSE